MSTTTLTRKEKVAITRAWGLAVEARQDGVAAARAKALEFGEELPRRELMLVIDEIARCKWQRAARLLP